MRLFLKGLRAFHIKPDPFSTCPILRFLRPFILSPAPDSPIISDEV